jgi:hypothetical protein
MPKKSSKKNQQIDITEHNEEVKEEEVINDLKLLNKKVLKQQLKTHEININRFLKFNGLIKLSY